MRHHNFRPPILILLFASIFFLFHSAYAQTQNTGNVSWSVNYETHNRVFIENKGQFDGRSEFPNEEILFAVDWGEQQIFFTKKGIAYRFEKRERNPARPKGNRTMPKRIKTIEFVHLTWEGANPDVVLQGEDINSDYHVYSFQRADKSFYQIDDVKGYQKLVYKNLYPNIDAEYVLHPEGGIKYSLIVHPGGNISKVNMNYAEGTKLFLSDAGKIIIQTSFGEITEHEPLTFYADNNSSVIPSAFAKSENSVLFQFGNYDKTRTIIIDPWVQTPALSNSNCVWEVEVDGAGNVYIIGGDSPMRLQKYNSTGVLQWTHNTPYSVASDSIWLGTFATDYAGNSYVTNGSIAAIQKINTNGNLEWNNPAPFSSSDEYWSIDFSCDQSKLIIGGTTNEGSPNQPSLKAAVFEIDANDGNVLGHQIVVRGNMYSFPPNPALQEVRSITSSYNGYYYFLTHDTIGAIHYDISSSPCDSSSATPFLKFKNDHGYKFGYKSENYRPRHGNGGMMAIKANKNFVYTHNGSTVHKRSLADGSVLATAALPGGINITTFGLNQAGNSGIAIDACGNVYAGSGDGVIKYDADLNLLTSVSTPFRVYDVAVSYNGEILIAGSTGDMLSATRTGYVQSVSMSACAPDSSVCCDAAVCHVASLLSTDTAIVLTPATPGGTWSGLGITDSVAGVFDPSVAGAGTHPITYTLSCGSDVVNIVVKNPPILEVCMGAGGNLVVSKGIGPYTWQKRDSTLDCSACVFSQCGSPPGCEQVIYTWTTFATGVIVSLPTSFPVKVEDNTGEELIIQNMASIPSCSDCVSMELYIISQSDVTCFGANNGSITVQATGGTPPYTYNWIPGNLSGESQSNLSAGSYTIVAEDNDGCLSIKQIDVLQPLHLSAGLIRQEESCPGANDEALSLNPGGGSPPYSFIWSTGATSNSITSLSPGSYGATITDANGCTVNIATSLNPAQGIGNITGPNYAIVNGTSVYYLSNLAGGIYQWTISGGTILSGQGGSIIEVMWHTPGNGLIEVTFTHSSCIESTSLQVFVDDGTGIFHPTLHSFKIYPNPTDEYFILIGETVSGQPEISLLNVLGQKTWTLAVSNDELKNGIRVSTENLPSGVYNLSIQNGGLLFMQKILVLK